MLPKVRFTLHEKSGTFSYILTAPFWIPDPQGLTRQLYMVFVQRLTTGRMFEKTNTSGSQTLSKKRANSSVPVPNDAYDSPNINPIRSYKFAV